MVRILVPVMDKQMHLGNHVNRLLKVLTLLDLWPTNNTDLLFLHLEVTYTEATVYMALYISW